MPAFLLPLLLQVTPVQPIVKGTGLPPPGTQEAAAMAPVDAILAAIARGDGAGVLANARPEGGLTVAAEVDGKHRVKRIGWAEFAAGLKPGDGYEERIVDPAIEVDGDIGYVWARYVVTKGGRIEHCGYDLFDLVREDGRWRVLNVTWSQRTTGCNAQ